MDFDCAVSNALQFAACYVLYARPIGHRTKHRCRGLDLPVNEFRQPLAEMYFLELIVALDFLRCGERALFILPQKFMVVTRAKPNLRFPDFLFAIRSCNRHLLHARGAIQ